MALPLRRLITCAALALAACQRPHRDVGAPPAADFLVSAGDSTFWVTSVHGRVKMRRAPMVLTRYGGRFYEIYVTDDDRSYYDAELVGQRIYRRDLVTGDSTTVFDDPLIPRLARSYAAAHPGERPLDDDEDGSDDPSSVATADAEIVDVHGPYLTYEYHTDIRLDEDSESHMTRRGVIDLRSGQPVTLTALFGDSLGTRLLDQGRQAFASAVQSVRARSDERGRLAANAIGDFSFDAASFSLTSASGKPAVAFLVPGRGDRAGGYALPLPPIPAAPESWWEDGADAIPRSSPDSSGDEWRGPGYDVVARYDSVGRAMLSVRDSARNEWTIGRIVAPTRRVYRLDHPAIDSVGRRALRRAFDASVLYSDDARTVLAPRAPRRRGAPPEFTIASWSRSGATISTPRASHRRARPSAARLPRRAASRGR